MSKKTSSKTTGKSKKKAKTGARKAARGGAAKLRSTAPTHETDAAYAAQELIYDAWETAIRKDRLALARQALAMWPDCADAWVLLAEEAAGSLMEAQAFYEKAVEAGERALGDRAFRDDVGYFWGLLETRPYMRARAGLARLLEQLERTDKAIEHYRELLRLNPDDNQGIRYLLLRALIATGRDDEAWRIVSQSDDIMASWLYPRALLAFRRYGKGAKADVMLQQAMEHNPFVPDFLLGRKRLPQILPDYIGVGDETEAMVFAAEYKALWQDTPGAKEWLKQTGTS